MAVFRAARVPASPCRAAAAAVRAGEAAAQRPGQLQGQVPAAAQPPAAVRLQQAHHRLAAHPGRQGLITINNFEDFLLLQEFGIQQILKMNIESIVPSIQEEMLRERPRSLGLAQHQASALAPQPLFEPGPHITPVNIFSRPSSGLPPHPKPAPAPHLPHHQAVPAVPPQAPPPQPPPPVFPGPFAEQDEDLERELESFRAAADEANNLAIKKQIEALKNIIAAQNKDDVPSQDILKRA